jgi:hypothetical protein
LGGGGGLPINYKTNFNNKQHKGEIMAKNIFFDPSEFLAQNDTLNYINYQTIREGNKEFLRNDVWDFEFLVPPNSAYFPGNNLLKTRMTGIEPQFPTGLTDLTATIRGFTIGQAIYSGTTSGSVTLGFVDREDQAITVFIDDWRDKLGTRENRFTFHKMDTNAEGRLIMMNGVRKPIRIYTLHSLQPLEGAGTLNISYGSDDPVQSGICQLPLRFEHFEVEYCNV